MLHESQRVTINLIRIMDSLTISISQWGVAKEAKTEVLVSSRRRQHAKSWYRQRLQEGQNLLAIPLQNLYEGVSSGYTLTVHSECKSLYWLFLTSVISTNGTTFLTSRVKTCPSRTASSDGLETGHGMMSEHKHWLQGKLLHITSDQVRWTIYELSIQRKLHIS